MTRVALPALIVLLAVAGMVAAAGWNTSREPLQVITLTERELALPVRGGAPGDDPGLQLTLQYEGRPHPIDSRNWLGEAQLRAIGFTMHVPAGSPQAVYTYDHVPPRIAWVVFEYEGPAWDELERRRDLQPADVPPRQHLRSRLVPIDAGPDAERLRARYPSPRHLIVRALFGLAYLAPADGGPLVYGTLRGVIPARVAVPHRFREVLRGLQEAEGAVTEPRYEVDLAVGRLGLVYVRSLRVNRELRTKN
jgi:hypothetical protein